MQKKHIREVSVKSFLIRMPDQVFKEMAEKKRGGAGPTITGQILEALRTAGALEMLENFIEDRCACGSECLLARTAVEREVLRYLASLGLVVLSGPGHAGPGELHGQWVDS